MKKKITIYLVLAVLLLLPAAVGCAPKDIASLPLTSLQAEAVNTLQAGTPLVPPAGNGYAEELQAHPEYLDGGPTYGWSKRSSQVQHGALVIFETKEDEVRFLSLEDFHLPTLLFRGKIIGLFGSVLVCRDKTHSYALDLATPKEWVQLQPLEFCTAFAHAGNMLYLYSSDSTSENAWCDAVDLGTLTATRTALPSAVYDAEGYNGAVYTAREQGLYKNDTLISEKFLGFSMVQESGHLFFYNEYSSCWDFDLETEQYREEPKICNSTFSNGLMIYRETEDYEPVYTYYRISDGEKVQPTYEELNRIPLSGGHCLWEEETETHQNVLQVSLGKTARRLELTGYSGTPFAHQNHLALVAPDALLLVDLKKNQKFHILSYEYE